MELKTYGIRTEIGSVNITGDWENGEVMPKITYGIYGRVRDRILNEGLWTCPGLALTALMQGLIKASIKLYGYKHRFRVDTNRDIAFLLLARLGVGSFVLDQILPPFESMVDNLLSEAPIFSTDVPLYEDTTVMRRLLCSWIAVRLKISGSPVEAMVYLALVGELYKKDPLVLGYVFPSLEMFVMFVAMYEDSDLDIRPETDMSYLNDAPRFDYVFPPQIFYAMYHKYGQWAIEKGANPVTTVELEIMARVLDKDTVFGEKALRTRTPSILADPLATGFANADEKEAFLIAVTHNDHSFLLGNSPLDRPTRRALQDIRQIWLQKEGEENVDLLKHKGGLTTALEGVFRSNSSGRGIIRSLSFQEWLELLQWYQDKGDIDSVTLLLRGCKVWPVEWVLKKIPLENMLICKTHWVDFLIKVYHQNNTRAEERRDVLERIEVLRDDTFSKKGYSVWST